MITKEAVLKALGNVDDPDLGKDLVTLNMVQDVEIDGNKVSFSVVLTTPACPMKEMIEKACINAIKMLVSKEAEVNIHMTSNVNSNRKDNKALLPQVKNIIAVASGKGGVGKSTVSVNLALGLAQEGAKVGLLDADIYGPSVPIMLGIKGERPKMTDPDGTGKGKIVPIEKFGIKAMSIGLLVDEKQAVVWRGPMASSALKQFITDVHWGELDYLIIDLPPGTGDVHLTLVQAVPITGSVVVSTPQAVASADAKKAIMMFKQPQINIPILGVVENMAYFTPAELPENKYYIFGQGGAKQMAEQFDLPYLGEVPIVEGIREGGDRGTPAVLDSNNPAKTIFMELSRNVARNVSMRNANMEPTKVVQMME
ncbi:MAG: Mrp/NBP35 family ATP-binding protein [Chitinophagales bacterium]|nr:Mrp/NBP35 family ATP-binding protein [Chitinophagaceae bacterium]MCB9065007.1 Mrp/NBP35 family ATP-binding protein [Chitinophagales bacterium]